MPYFTLKNIPDNNNLKTLGAALASSGSVALYHMENVTPEYDVAAKSEADDHIAISEDDILDTRNKLSTTTDEPDLICLGCPHASLEEIKEVANIVKGKSIKNKLPITPEETNPTGNIVLLPSSGATSEGKYSSHFFVYASCTLDNSIVSLFEKVRSSSFENTMEFSSNSFSTNSGRFNLT